MDDDRLAGEMGVYTKDDYIAQSGGGDSTIANYRLWFRLLENHMGASLERATRADITRLKAKLRTMRSGHHLAMIARSFYKRANKPDFVDILKVRRNGRRPPPEDYPQPEEVKLVIEKADSLRDRAFIGALWEIGGRAHELLALDLADVKEDPKRKRFVLFLKKVKVPGQEHKGYILDTYSLMSAWLKAHPQRGNPSAPLFPAWGGGCLTVRGAGHIVDNAARRAGVQRRVRDRNAWVFHPHALKHARVTYLQNNGMPLSQIAVIVGTSAQMLSKTYTQTTEIAALKGLEKATGHEDEMAEVGKPARLLFGDEDLIPVAPMNAPPGAANIRGEETPDVIPPLPHEVEVNAFKTYIATAEGRAWWEAQQAKLVQSLKEALAPMVKAPVAPPAAPQAASK